VTRARVSFFGSDPRRAFLFEELFLTGLFLTGGGAAGRAGEIFFRRAAGRRRRVRRHTPFEKLTGLLKNKFGVVFLQVC